jgi:6-phosphogluconolactonase (cycloisomerase 2 family)
VIFERNKTTGAITQLDSPNGCVALDGDGVTCTAAIGLEDPRSLVVSKNGKHVYVVSYVSDALTVFDRHATTGALTQLPAPEGCHSQSGDGVTCTEVVALNGPYRIAQSNDGKNLYIAALQSSGVAAFGRDKISGEVEQLYFPNACTTATGDNVLCRPGLGLSNARSVALPKNGKHLYVASFGSDAVAVFRRIK